MNLAKKKKKKNVDKSKERTFATTTDGKCKYIKKRHVEELEEHGYTIVENVLSTEECERGEEIFYKWIENLGNGR